MRNRGFPHAGRAGDNQQQAGAGFGGRFHWEVIPDGGKSWKSRKFEKQKNRK
jgi:hypothetical protein